MRRSVILRLRRARSGSRSRSGGLLLVLLRSLLVLLLRSLLVLRLRGLLVLRRGLLVRPGVAGITAVSIRSLHDDGGHVQKPAVFQGDLRVVFATLPGVTAELERSGHADADLALVFPVLFRDCWAASSIRSASFRQAENLI